MIRPIFLAATVLLLSASATAQITWNFNSSAEGWTALNAVQNVTGGGGTLSYQYTGANDPHIGSPAGLGLATANMPYFSIYVEWNPVGAQSEAMQVFFTGTMGDWGEPNSVVVPIQPGARMYEINMAANPNWNGTLDQIRIDIGNNGANLGTSTAVIHFIHLGRGRDFQFNSAGNAEGWSPNGQISGFNVAGGSLNVTFPNVGTTDPFMSISNTAFDSDAYRYIVIRQNPTGLNTNNYTGGEIHAFPGSLGANFVRKGWGYYANTGYSRIILDMGQDLAGSNPSNNQWAGKGTITGWRIDNSVIPLSNWQPSGQISYDFITVTDTPPTQTGPYLWDFSGSGPGSWVTAKHSPYNGTSLNVAGGTGTVSGANTLAIQNLDLALNTAFNWVVFDVDVSTTVARNNFEVRLFWIKDGQQFSTNRFRLYNNLPTNVGMQRYAFNLNTVGGGAGAWDGIPHGLLMQFGTGEGGVNNIVVDNIELRSAPPAVINSIADATIPDNAPYSLSPSLSAGAPATWSKTAGPASLTVNPSTGAVNWPSPTVAESGLVTIQASNANGGDTESWTLTVTDATPPVISRNGSATVNHECGTPYVDAGATASDNVDGNISGSIVTNNPVNSAVPGPYTVTYNVQDAAGNNAVEVTRTVNVVDTTAPTITRTGLATVTVECGATYTDAGATAADGCDGNLTGSIVTNNPVNTAIPGPYTVTYDVQDAAGNNATQVTRTVNVVDTTAPTITLTGASTVNVECGTVYTDAGATATDACEGNLSGSIVANNPVDTNVPGPYTVTYDVQDGEGNNATQVTRTVNVVDTTAPVITRTGPASVTIVVGQNYTDQGATASDACDGNLTGSIVTNNPVDINTADTYTVTYDVQDAEGNNAVQVTRTVNVVTGNPPVITLLGDAAVTVECLDAYVDAGATASDVEDGNLTGSIAVVNPVNTATPGVYEVTYNVTDSSGNPATEVVRTVTVEDTGAPTILLTGPASATVNCGEGYADPGATASDNCEGVVSNVVSSDISIVATTPPGVYTITYSVTDAAGNPAAPVTRTVEVLDNCPLSVNADTPSEVSTEAGNTVTFTVSADDAVGALSYQWKKDDSNKAFLPLPGANGSSLTLNGVGPADSGVYLCSVSDAVTTVDSPLFTLTVEGSALPVTGLAGLAGLAALLGVAGLAVTRRKA